MKKALIIFATAAVTAVTLLCITVLLLVFNIFGLRDGLTASTGWFYPEPLKISKIADAEELWGISLPEGSYIEDQFAEKPIIHTDDIYYIRYKPYCYDVRLIIPKEETDSFADSLRALYNDREEEKAYVTFPRIMSDIDEKELTYYFLLREDAVTEGSDKGFVELHAWKSIYIIEQEDQTTVLLSLS